MKKSLIIVVMLLVSLVSVFALAGCVGNSQFKVIDIKLTDEDYAFAVQKGNAAMLASVNELIAEMKESGEIDALLEKYMFGNEDDFVSYKNPTASANLNTQLVVATSPDFPPFENVLGDGFTGADIEIAIKLAEKLGKPLFIERGDFDSVLLNIGSNKAHIGMAGLTITEDRKLSVDFSDVYFNSSQVLVAKADDTTFDNCKTAEDVYAILNALESNTKIGFQNGTTGEFFVTNGIDDSPVNFKATPSGYKDGTAAMTDLGLGRINFVIIDQRPAEAMVAKLNLIK